MKKIIIISVFTFVLIGVLAIVLFHLFNFPVRQTKDYATMYVDQEDILDSKAMVSPPEKYSQLLQIDIELRIKVAKYMEKNNFKLKAGEQMFIRINPTFEELIEDGFLFESLD